MIAQSVLFPPKCVLCGNLLHPHELDLCTHCRIHTPPCASYAKTYPFLDTWIALWYYEDLVRRSLLRYKFHGRRHYAAAYGRLLAMKLLQEREGMFDVLTWVPISRWRNLQRGYDQVKLLANAVGREWPMKPVACLRKKRHNPPQSGIAEASQRRANVLGAYGVRDVSRIAGKRVLILDDIMTTGSTLCECARVLRTAGASEVHGAVVAVVRPHATDRLEE